MADEEAENASNIQFISENMDLAIIEQVKDIKKKIADTFPLVSEKEAVSSLEKDFASGDEVYRAKLKDLQKRYSHIRRTRGDGNCFYRSFGFRTLELCRDDLELLERVRQVSTKTKDKLIGLGYPSHTVEDFLETFIELLDVTKKSESIDEIIQLYNEQSYSDYLVVFLRLIVSCFLQENQEFYGAFIEGYTSMKDFCSQEVEPMAKESDHIHIIALTSALNMKVLVEYMDRGGDGAKVNSHSFPDDGSEPLMRMLYRPGHYDILYPHQ